MVQGLRQGLIGLIVMAGALLGLPAAASAAETGWAIEEHGLYRALPDVLLTDETGRARRLAAWSKETPLLVTFAYARCTGICSPLLRQLHATTDRLGGRGDRYRVVVVALDQADTPKLLQAFARSQGIRGPGWSFTTAAREDVARLEAAVGGWSRPLPDGQIDHPALVGAVREGVLVQTVAGADFQAPRLAVALAEAQGDFLPVYPAPESDMALRCFSFRLDGQGFGLDWGIALLLAPAGLAFGATALIFRPRRGP
ncbi:MAG: SCO family protein [Candidatus Sericytochromatia bacterium]